jgi:hypothetical protein
LKPQTSLLIAAAFLLQACTLPTPAASTAPQPPADTETPAVPPTRTPDPFPDPVLKITGDLQVVFDWTTDRCENANIPDLPARAFRSADGQVNLTLAETTMYVMRGPDLNSVKVVCDPVMKSAHLADPSMYADNEWISGVWTDDGQTVYALVHNEYQGHTHPGQCPQHDYFPCWDNSITLAISTDGGRNFTHALPPPANLVARLPYQYEAGAGPDGARTPSNIIKGPDGYFYSFFNQITTNTHKQSTCLMRTDNLADPASWRYWNGSAFEGTFVDPYLDTSANPADHICPKLAGLQIGDTLNDSVIFDTYLNRYVLVGLSADQINGKEVWGIYYSFSDDLLQWTHRKLLAEMPLPWTVANGGSDLSILYPSMLDPASDSPSFETFGKAGYLYYTRHNHGQGSLDRDLVRVPVEFFPSP